MKKSFTLSLFISQIMMSALMADTIIPAGQGEDATLGYGLNTDTQKFVGNCLNGTEEKHGQQIANLSFTQALSQTQLSNELGMDAGTRFSYGAATVKASAKFAKSSQSSGFSISAVYAGDYKFKNSILVFPPAAANATGEALVQQRLSGVGQSVRNNDQRWSETCGGEYVAQIERGAKLFYSIKIDFMSTEEKQQFEAAFSYDSSFASVSALLKTQSKSFSKRTRVTVGALQIGGDVSKLTEIFDDNAETSTEAALGFVKCSFGNLADCDAVMANAIRYATRDFKKQLESKPDSPAYEGGPAYLKYITKPYSSAGIYQKFSSVMNQAILQKRRQVEKLFANEMRNLGQVNSILENQAVVLSPKQDQKLKAEQQKLDRNIDVLVKAGEICYNTPESCQETVLASVEELKTFDETSLVIEPQVFRQYCALTESTLATEKIKVSIAGMLEAAKALEPNAFPSSNAAGGTAAPTGSDICLQAHMVFKRNSHINTLANRNIQTLDPLKEYDHFVEVDLSDNQIESLEPLKEWKNLELLNLRNNRVRSLDPLARLANLSNLIVSKNRLRSIEVMQNSPSLTRIDARSNSPDISCEQFRSTISCLSATVRTDASFSLLSTNLLGELFMPSVAKLSNGEILIVGSGNNAFVYDSHRNEFRDRPQLDYNSYSRELTPLNDGRVLVSGGWQSKKVLSIFDSNTRTFRTVAKLNTARVGHTSTVLYDGRVLITGGWDGHSGWTGSDATNTAEIFDPKTEKLITIKNMHAPRAWHTATRLANGQVLIVGGFRFADGLATAELFDPKTNRFTQLQRGMQVGRGAHTATLLPFGKVLFTGGFSLDTKATSVAEIFDPNTQSFVKLSEPMNRARAMHSTLLLKNGKVLITGGSREYFAPDAPLPKSPDSILNSAEIFDPMENSFLEVTSTMNIQRAQHKMIEVTRGSVLVLGGMSTDSVMQSEVFDYVDGQP